MSDDTEDHGPPARRSVSALWERVETHGSMLRSLTEEVAAQFRDTRAETQQAITTLANSTSAQVAGVTASIDKLTTKLETNAAATAERQRPQYLALFMGVIAAIGLSVTIMQVLTGLHDKPVDDKLTTLAQAISDLNRTTSAQIADIVKNTQTAFGEAARNTVSEREFQQAIDNRDKIQAAVTAGRDTVRGAMEKEIQTLAEEYKATAANVVPRNEHQFHWDAEAKTDERLQAQIDSLGRRLDNLSPAGDVMARMGRDLHDLEVKVYGAH